MVVYLDDFDISAQRPIRLLRYEQVDRWQTDYAPVCVSQLRE